MLSTTQKNNLIKLIDFEIEHYLCEIVPKYQSFSDMHVKHKDSNELSIVLKNIVLLSYGLTGQWTNIKLCWFNVLKENSDHEFHSHETLTAVYFLKGCTNNGTFVLDNGKTFQLPSTDNTVQFLGASVMHSIPKWSGVDRYSIAVELISK